MEEVIEDIINMESSFNDEGIGCSETPLLMQRTVSILWNFILLFIIKNFTEWFKHTSHFRGLSSTISGLFPFLFGCSSFCHQMLEEGVPMWWDTAVLSGLNSIWGSSPAAGLAHNPFEVLSTMQHYG